MKKGFFMSTLACWVNIWVQQCPFEFEKPFHETDICQNMWRNYREVLMQANTFPCVCKHTLLKCTSMKYTRPWPKQVFVAVDPRTFFHFALNQETARAFSTFWHEQWKLKKLTSVVLLNLFWYKQNNQLWTWHVCPFLWPEEPSETGLTSIGDLI